MLPETMDNIRDWSEITEKLVRTALKSTGFIGELYDARTETFCSRSLFSSLFPTDFIKTRDISDSKIEYSYTDKLSDRFDLLKVETDLQLPVLLGRFSVEGHGKYLSEEKKSERIISCSLLYNISTVCEKLLAPFKEIEEFIDRDVFLDEQYTHAVVQINWGGNCTVSLEYSNIGSDTKNEVEGKLKVELMKLGSIMKGDGTYISSDRAKLNNINFNVHADVLPEEGSIPNTMEFLLKFPELIKRVNEGKGKPLNYVMLPISTFKKLCKYDKTISAVIIKIDESFIIQLVCFFEELSILKQKLHDLETDFSQYEKYLPSDCLSKIREMQRNIKANETQLKTELVEGLPHVKAGKTKIKDLIILTERHKSSDLSLCKIREFIDEFKDVKSKIDDIDICLSKGIIYLGKDETLDSFMNRNTNNDLYVMYISRELCEKNKDLSRETFIFFLSQAENPKRNTRYIIVDSDVSPNVVISLEEVKIVYYIQGIIVSHDAYKDHKTEKSLNLAVLPNPFDVTYIQYKPNKRVLLKLQCPGFRRGTCPDNPLIWTCLTCKNNLEYGFNDFFYCSCGEAPTECYQLKCSSLSHGNEYLPVRDFPYLKEELGKLRPLDEMNILILGQSGVGKSTWINSIVNYGQYETLKEAEEGEVISVIPANFTVTYMTAEGIQRQVVEVGKKNPNEVTSIGKSSTQGPKTYTFFLENKAVRLIDTPGLGDTGGIDRDKENMEKILDHISFLKEIHGICILMKSNETRINVLFRFCIKELLSHLHKNAARNILFCFTNSRASFYSPGDTSIVLDQLLRELKLDDMISLCERTMFSLDNEAFRFLCTLKYPNIPHTSEDRTIYGGSWTRSVRETKRLFQQIKELKPHVVADTTTLCKARNRILNLTKPLGEITKTIQLNLTAIAEEEKKIESSKLSLTKLAKRLHVPHIELKAEPLNYPRTVCTNSKCVRYYKLKATNVTLIEYTQICHDNCRLLFAVANTLPLWSLRFCRVMSWGLSRYCSACGCKWTDHMHYTYNQRRIETSVVNSKIEKKINYKKNSKAIIEEHKQKLEETTKQYEAEQNAIVQISVKFGIFLKENAIAPYNDGFKDYLKYLIKEEENKVNKTEVEDDLLKHLNDTMSRYENEIKILEERMKGSDLYDTRNKLTPEDISNLENELYDLELTGQQIKQNVEMSVYSNDNAQRYAEEPLPIKSKLSSIFEGNSTIIDGESTSSRRVKKVWKGVTNFIDFF